MTGLTRFILILASSLLSLFGYTDSKTKSNESSNPYFGLTPPGSTPVVFAPGIVSTDAFEHSAVAISPDLKEIYWTTDNTSGQSVIKFSHEVNGTWTAPAIAPFSVAGDGDPTFSFDGNRLYFLSFRQGDGSEDIWYVERAGDGWSAPVHLNQAINGQQLHWQISLAKDGSLYFGSHRAGSINGTEDIYKSQYENGDYGTPVNLGEPINTNEYEHSPFIARDGSYLLFSRVPVGSPDCNLFISYRQEDGRWSTPVAMDAINSPAHDQCPVVSPDGKYLFFNSHRSGNADVYWVDAKFLKSYGPSDLEGVKMKVKPKKPSLGSDLKVTVEVRNNSEYSSLATDITYYISKKKRISKKSILLGKGNLEALIPGDNIRIKNTFELSKKIKPGGYYVLAVIDEADLNYDTNRKDNLVFSAKKILLE